MAAVTRRTRRAVGTTHYPVRSVRISDPVWEKARKRAERDGVTISQVINTFVEGYADKMVDLPRVEVIYSPRAS